MTNASVTYIREPSGELLARVSGSAVHYYHFDELGSTRLITDGSGAVTDRYAYDAYGAVISHDRNTGTIDQPYQYAGQLGYYTHGMVPEFGWLQLGVRFYQPELGRFERRDPVRLAGGLDSYNYARNDPLRFIDPRGEFSSLWCGLVCVPFLFNGLAGACLDLCSNANDMNELRKVLNNLMERRERAKHPKCQSDCENAPNKAFCMQCCEMLPDSDQEACLQACESKTWNQPGKKKKK